MWTYDATRLESVAPGRFSGSTIGQRYQIRLLIQDTREARPLLQDEEIDWFQTQEMNAYTMAARCCETLVVRAGSVKQKKVGDLQITYDVGYYRSLAAELRARGACYQEPYAGGISISDKLAQQADPDWVPPRIGIATFDNPQADQPGPGPAPGSKGFPTV